MKARDRRPEPRAQSQSWRISSAPARCSFGIDSYPDSADYAPGCQESNRPVWQKHQPQYQDYEYYLLHQLPGILFHHGDEFGLLEDTNMLALTSEDLERVNWADANILEEINEDWRVD